MDREAEEFTYIVNASEAGLRLDEFVHKQEAMLPLGAVRRAIEAGDVLVNGQHRSSGWRLRAGNRVTVELSSHLHRALVAEPIPLDILYEDDHIIAVNKPPSMLSHPSLRERRGSLINALIYHFQQHQQADKSTPWPALVHRLDRDTSGVILIAKQERALQKLSHQFNERRVQKTYLAIVFGQLDPQAGLIDAPIGRHPALWPRWRIMEKEGKPAQTRYWVEEQLNDFALVKLELLTGRTHQLRIHLAHIGHPIVGDQTYGRRLNKELTETHTELHIKRQLLHAATLTFQHPIIKETISLEAPLPKDMAEFLTFARQTVEAP
ncbi:MAG: RluA family pseudouridine synthase [Acidobacteriota bacterium]